MVLSFLRRGRIQRSRNVRNEEARKRFDNQIPGQAFARILDVTDDEKVPAVVTEIENKIGGERAQVWKLYSVHERTVLP